MTATNEEILYLLATINAGEMFEPVPRCGAVLRVCTYEGLTQGQDCTPHGFDTRDITLTPKGKARLEAGLS